MGHLEQRLLAALAPPFLPGLLPQLRDRVGRFFVVGVAIVILVAPETPASDLADRRGPLVTSEHEVAAHRVLHLDASLNANANRSHRFLLFEYAYRDAVSDVSIFLSLQEAKNLVKKIKKKSPIPLIKYT